MLAHFDGDVTRANISPRRRARILRRYPAPTAPRHPDGATGGSAPETSGESAASDAALAWRCPGCAYTYDVVAGDEREGFAAGTPWSEIPWTRRPCPDCGVRDKVDFRPLDR